MALIGSLNVGKPVLETSIYASVAVSLRAITESALTYTTESPFLNSV